MTRYPRLLPELTATELQLGPYHLPPSNLNIGLFPNYRRKMVSFSVARGIKAPARPFVVTLQTFSLGVEDVRVFSRIRAPHHPFPVH